jgi:hypothetical protein
MTDLAGYEALLARKVLEAPPAGMEDVPELHPDLKPHQRHVTEFALRAGRSAEFMDTGLGKSFSALEWGRVVAERTGRPVLMLSPLAVAPQHRREAERWGIPARVVRSADELAPGVNLANYEKLPHFRPEDLGGVVLDESSILKTFTGVYSRRLVAFGAGIPFRLACTATPAPNDHTELGQHSAFLGVMPSAEMLSRFFVTDQAEMGRYRLKGHAVAPFWSWVASWARCVSRPSDLGFPDDGYDLPPLDLRWHTVRADILRDRGDTLFRLPGASATDIHREKRITAEDRARVVAELVHAEPGEPWCVWVDTDYEADAVMALLAGAPGGVAEVRGSMPEARKEAGLLGFADGTHRVIVTKPSIAGFGLNWQHCARTAFAGVNFSYEAFYQALRRFWRFGQLRPVRAHAVLADTEQHVRAALSRKQDGHDAMRREMAAAMRRSAERRSTRLDYNPTAPMRLPSWIRSAA